MLDLVRYIKGLEKEFLEANRELKTDNPIEFLRKRDEFVSEKMVERREDVQE
jgi:hypothetical protein